jgi:hypothetical protein
MGVSTRLGDRHGGGSIEVKSKKQTLVTKSSFDLELVAASDMSSEVIKARDFLLAQSYRIGPTRFEQDDTSCISSVKKGVSQSI